MILQNKLTLLSTFEVAARYLSFKLAADELCLTPSAISHRIQQLEKQLGFRLFLRMTRKLVLTEDGNRLLRTLTKSLRRIDDEIEDIRYNDLRGTLTLGIAPILGQLWLMPRLPDFQQRWPSLNVMLRVRAGTVNFDEEHIDLAIYYGATHYPDLYRELLFEEQLLPVCSPAYAAQLGLSENPDRLSEACFLHASESTDVQNLFSEWRIWCEASNISLPLEERYYGFNNYTLALQAALNGMGILMGRYILIKPMLESGQLVSPCGPMIPAGRNYELFYPEENAQRPRLKAFTDWMKEQILL
ncbi:transcriptional regulator, LysR family [Tolumonas auensis DSM 9187]|uniref:Transcriptional regulator, LysR family n=1 Tax=Tolumonas auensis (strain DSM 9187 / NBRC 110442 / TA 4) TaxID=595494 RepID=C4LCQ0_TOLAT|nr:LysR substrate-binding domain-containing protein [Tolumonas auensis]ACQ92614.1 transcriptional regulator, LysR family [Tolumonas auensis DSM 9187]